MIDLMYDNFSDYDFCRQYVDVDVLPNSDSVLKALSAVKTYLSSKYDVFNVKKIENELRRIANVDVSAIVTTCKYYSYDSLQCELATLNEKSEIRKLKGVYYTPDDIVNFILFNSVKFFYNEIETDCFGKSSSDILLYKKFCYDCTFFDPTCGSGVFLLAALEFKIKWFEKNFLDFALSDVRRIVGTIFGNDVDADSVLITKLRLFLCVLDKCGVDYVTGLAEIFNQNFFQCDFVSNSSCCSAQKYDIILGNPPYVEDSKATSSSFKKYGNIYANVLSNASKLLKNDGVMGFIIPLSYVSTPRMKKIREELLQCLPKQYILSFADRPDCLFVSVHQKLCILFAGSKGDEVQVFTSNYQYWYKEERKNLFDSINIVANRFCSRDFIPKIGTMLESKIYEKILLHKKSMTNLFVPYGVPIYLNMRATYWIKAFLTEHTGAEYKIFNCGDEESANLLVLLLNSSLFWWYWICVSDCWHITNKELTGFRLPQDFNPKRVKELVNALENRLETTKVYVGTKQTEYEYKHKSCTKEIHEIDDYVNALYSLNEEENFYIKNFAYRYRTGGGGIKF